MAEDKGPRPAVYARLRHDHEARDVGRRSSRRARWLGLVLIAAIVVVVALAVAQAGS